MLALVAHQSSQIQAMRSLNFLDELGTLSTVTKGVKNAANAVQEFFQKQYLKMKQTYNKWRETITSGSLKKLETKKLKLETEVKRLNEEIDFFSNRYREYDPIGAILAGKKTAKNLETATAKLKGVETKIANLTNLQSSRLRKIAELQEQLTAFVKKNESSLNNNVVNEFNQFNRALTETLEDDMPLNDYDMSFDIPRPGSV